MVREASDLLAVCAWRGVIKGYISCAATTTAELPGSRAGSRHWFSVMGMAKCQRLAGKPSEGGYIIIDPIHPEMRSMTWTCYRSSAQRATLLSYNRIRP